MGDKRSTPVKNIEETLTTRLQGMGSMKIQNLSQKKRFDWDETIIVLIQQNVTGLFSSALLTASTVAR